MSEKDFLFSILNFLMCVLFTVCLGSKIFYIMCSEACVKD